MDAQNFIVQVSDLKLGKPGPPSKVWSLGPDAERKIVASLEPVYQEIAIKTSPRRVLSAVYQFVDSDVAEDPAIPVAGTTFELTTNASGLQVSVPVTEKLEPPRDAEIFIVDAEERAAGLASLVMLDDGLVQTTIVA
jgi:hypothetical protein